MLPVGAAPGLRATVLSGGDGWLQVGELGLALALSSVIGVEREIRQKSAGLRTHTLVGVGAALFMLISKYGFSDVLVPGKVELDPSRVAAQIVTGVGFLGAGIIFVRRDSVRGLTTAAAIWTTAAVGAAAGAGLFVLASVTTAVYLVVTLAFPALTDRLPAWSPSSSVLKVRYPDGRGMLRQILDHTTSQGFVIDDLSTGAVGPGDANGHGHGHGGDRREAARHLEPDADASEAVTGGEVHGPPAGAGALPPGAGERSGGDGGLVEVTMHVRGKGLLADLAAELSEIPGVEAVLVRDDTPRDE